MRRTALALTAAIAVTTGIALGAGTAAGSASSPMTLVYDTTSVTHQLVFPRSGPGLSPSRGALRQDPGIGGMFARGNNAAYRVSKISGASLSGMSVTGMVNALERQIRRGQYGAQAHLVAVDELMETYADPRSGHLSAGVGMRFSTAMGILASAQSPWGGTWASRVEIYVSPGVVSSIAIGYGPQHNLSPAGRVQYRSWRGVMPGLAAAGGLHLEMYHGNGTGFSTSLWRRAPHAFLDLLSRYGGNSANVHFVLSGTSRPAGAPSGWGGAMNATWSLARSTPAGRTILDNGVDEYRLGAQAGAWLAQYNRQFPG